MSLRNRVAALLLPLALAACGFSPIAAVPTSVGEQDLVLSDIDVVAADRRFAYRLRKELMRSVEIDPTAPQSLKLTTSIDVVGLAIQQNDTITRRNITAQTDYALVIAAEPGATEPPEPIRGDTSAITAVNATAAQFSTNVSEREAIERLAVETARRIVTFLRVNRSS